MNETVTETIYAPPKADVSESLTDEPPFYVVGTTKFFLLSLFTLGLYLVYWFYRNWRNIKLHNGEDIWPVPRGLFYIFFTHSLFTDVEEKLKSIGSDLQWQPQFRATAFVALAILVNVLDRMAGREIGSPATDVIGTLLLPLMPLLLLPAQRAINTASGDPDGLSNSKLTLVNWLWMILGLLAWLLVAIGLYFIVFEPDLLVD